MNVEKFISEQKHPEPALEQAADLGAKAGKEQFIGREKVLKIFKKTRPEAADVFLLPHGL